ncbi:unnamed protein product [Calypogeia fissa]
MASRTMVSKLQLLVPLLVVFFLATCGEVIAQPVTCQTSVGSPSVVDAVQCVDALVANGTIKCCQSNCAGSDACTNLCFSGTAATDICGNCGLCVPCEQAGSAVATIIENCEDANGNAEGNIPCSTTDATLNMKLYHT